MITLDRVCELLHEAADAAAPLERACTVAEVGLQMRRLGLHDGELAPMLRAAELEIEHAASTG